MKKEEKEWGEGEQYVRYEEKRKLKWDLFLVERGEKERYVEEKEGVVLCHLFWGFGEC